MRPAKMTLISIITALKSPSRNCAKAIAAIQITVMAMAMLLTHAQEFLDRRFAFDHLAKPILVEVVHARLDSFLSDGIQVRVLTNQLADLVGDDEQLEDAGAL